MTLEVTEEHNLDTATIPSIEVADTSSYILPDPPNDQEKYSYARSRTWVLTICSLISISCLAYSQFELVWSSPALCLYLPFLLLTILYYCTSLRVNAFSHEFDLAAHCEMVGQWHPKTYPTVAIFLPVCGEPIEVLYNTWQYVRGLANRYPGKVTAYVLDDSDNPELAALASEFSFSYGSRANRGWFKKAGNLHYGLSISDEEFILILDADFAPRADLLEELMPYMEANPKIGIVQSPQYFRVHERQSWIERGAGAVQELFYRAIQVSRQNHDGSICVGSCAVYRRAALNSNGGTTLIEHSEDVHTGFDLRGLGWELRYVPINLAAGICPDTASSFFNQQYRWCSGSMSLLGSRKFWSAKLSLATRLCYMSGFFYYIHTALFTFLAPLIPITLLLTMPNKFKVGYTLLLLPSVIYATCIFPLWHRCAYGLEAWAVRMMYGWSHLFAIWDILMRRRMAWRPTGSVSAKQGAVRRFRIGVFVWGGGSALAWVCLAAWRAFTLYPPDFALSLAGALFYAVIVGRVMFQPRVADTQRASLDVRRIFV
ncbi:glycosyltransferase family 2 protein [Streptomyces sp. NPDC048362]|uniref:glycosyltransferase family 2 protein n=1 Tax=Streptomyces sp. NPDC048362 TaxID=3365539 RepID=UPI00371983E6